MRLCIDLNVWCADVLATQYRRKGTAAQSIVEAVRSGSARTSIQLVISLGMLQRLELVVARDLDATPEEAAELVDVIADYARVGPSLILGGVGVLPILDDEDRHVLETAWAGRADVLVTSDFAGFLSADATVITPGRLARLERGGRRLWLIHPFAFAAWLRGEAVAGFEPAT